jgi:hypothetical protein
MSTSNNYREIFGNINTEPYKIDAERFLPDKIDVLFIFESPPFPPPINSFNVGKNLSWSYFYRHESKGSDFLRNKISDTLFNEKMSNAKAFLKKFADKGYFLISAVNYPINKITEDKGFVKITSKGVVDSKERQKIIYSESSELVKTIEYWIQKSCLSKIEKVNMLIIKVPVFNGLMNFNNPFKKKEEEGVYKVLNNYPIPFPMPPFDAVFKREVRKLLNINY